MQTGWRPTRVVGGYGVIAVVVASSLASSCNNEGGVTVYNTEPGVSIVSPADSSTFAEGEVIEFEAIVDDAQDSADVLLLTWSSDLDGVLSDGSADANGVAAYPTANLSPGSHVIELKAVDSAAASGNDVVSVTVEALPDAPDIAILSPELGDKGVEGELFTFSAEVFDAQDETTTLAVVFLSDRDGVFCEPIPEPTGLVACEAELSVGAHDLTYEVADADGEIGRATTYFEVQSSSAVDLDGDGYTGDEGDCDDTDPDVHPGATEVVNGVDDDCNGLIDDGTDAYDDDGDGFSEDLGDCDDGDATVYPGAPEVCDGVDDDCDLEIDEGTECVDDDGDGFAELDGDCDDADAAAYPGAPEVIDGVDNDCNGFADDGTTAYDDDGDCFCEAAPCVGSANLSCVSVDEGDCNDGNSLIGPHMTELCDGLDNDCDLFVDEEDAADARDWYEDADGDGYGDPLASAAACDVPSGYVANDDDCDDAEPSVHPGGVEVCDGLDNDCDFGIDEGLLTTWYADDDGDGYGNGLTGVDACTAPTDHVPDGTDCDDLEAAVNPGASEVCNGVDDDCDLDIDEDSSLDAGLWFLDRDTDGYGDPTATWAACAAPSGYVGNDDDCNDFNGTVSPAGVEVCNGLDEDCDGVVDDGTDCFDDDGDGYTELVGDCDDSNPYTWPGAPELGDGLDNDCDGDVDEGTSAADDDGDGFSEATGDCNDADPAVSPSATEVCNGIDDDCDLDVDESDAADVLTWYIDADGDDHGDSSLSMVACDQPGGYAATDDDCDDGDADINPSATEVCNGVDDDCDGGTDTGLLVESFWDGDGDGFGNAAINAFSCSPAPGYVLNDEDCDDTDGAIHPLGTEVCNGADDDCSGTADDGAIDASTWYQDGDGDGYGDTSPTQEACELPSGYADNNDDCNDLDPGVSPGAAEVCNGVDDDCDTVVDDGTECFDDDGDGYTEVGGDCDDTNLYVYPGAVEFIDGVDNDCNGSIDDGTDGFDDDGDGYAETDGDCNDADAGINPGEVEVCDLVDNDCDLVVDEDDAADAVPWYVDSDGDGFGDPLGVHIACWTPTGHVANDDDCDDGNAGIYLGAAEVCDGADNDCDTAVDEGVTSTYYADSDGDGYGDPTVSTEACSAPSGYVADATDCLDSDITVNPAGTEVCNGVDDDCEGGVDEDAVDATVWYVDGDGDGFGLTGSSMTTCDTPKGYSLTDGDCNDGDSGIFPGAAEVCDGVDDNCDGTADEGATTRYYRDWDGDSYGDPTLWVDACSAPAGYIVDDQDCDDSDASINPDTVWYRDSDEDGYGRDSGANRVQCNEPGSSYSLLADDCDDGDSAVNPGATESCNGIDDDCDTTIDEQNATGCDTWYFDGDGDGQGDPTDSRCLCAASGSYDVDNGDDCADNDPLVYLGSTAFYSFPNANGDYDYNCDSNEEQKFVKQFECTTVVLVCQLDSTGWDGPIPNCGVTDTWADDCQMDAGVCVADATSSKTQECR